MNSLRSWNSSGFLGLLSERHIILNDPLPAEHAMALDFGLNVIQPKDIPNAKMAKPNVLTIGAAFYYALQSVDSECVLLLTVDIIPTIYALCRYLIFLENDFKMDIALSVEEIKAW